MSKRTALRVKMRVGPEVEEELAVAGGAANRGEGEAQEAEVVAGGPAHEAADDGGVDEGVFDDALLAHLFAAGRELGHEEDDELAAGLEGAACGRDDLFEADEGEVEDGEVAGFGQWRQGAGVGALHDDDAVVGAQLVVEDAVADVDCVDLAGAVLQQAVREAACGSAEVHAGPAGGVDVKGREGVGELVAATADIRGFLEDFEGGRVRDEGAGFGDRLAIDADVARHENRLRLLAAGDEAALDEEGVDAGAGGSPGHTGRITHAPSSPAPLPSWRGVPGMLS